MTHRERFIKALKCEPIGGQVPTFELVFFLTMEAFGKVHPSHRYYSQWDQMSYAEKKLHIEDNADIYIRTAQRYGHSAIFIHPNPGDYDNVQWLLETIREKTGDEFFTYAGSKGHYILVSGYREFNGEDQVYINNPLSWKSSKWFDVEDLMDNACNDWQGYENSFVVIYK